MAPPEFPVLTNRETRRTVGVQRNRGSRWFGPTGLAGPARSDDDPSQHETDDTFATAAARASASLTRTTREESTLSVITHEESTPSVTPGSSVAPATSRNTHSSPRNLDWQPSWMQQMARGQIPYAPRAPIQRQIALGVSPNYRGDINLPRNLSANISEEENCSFWITRLPANTTVHALLRAIRNVGRIYCTVMSPPNPHSGLLTAAAKVVFFDGDAAQTFWDRYGRGGRQQLPFMVDNLEAIVKRNRVRVEAQSYPRCCSRVLCVSGIETVINVDALIQEFQESFVSEMDQVLVHPAEGPGGIRNVEFHFGSFRCQSQTAFRLLRGREGVEVWFGRDPCQ